MDKRSGEVVWRATGPGERSLHGEWSSPVAANVNGRIQVLFGGGDGWLRSYDAASGHEIWRFDGNPKDARFLPRPGVFSRSSIIASPVFADGKIYCLAEDAATTVLAPGPTFEQLAVNKLDGQAQASPAIVDGAIYLRTDTHLYRIEKSDLAAAK